MNFLFIKENYTKILCSTTVFNIDNNQKCFLIINQYIIMISEGHVTEDWSNDAEHIAAHHRNT